MIDRGMRELTGARTLTAAWKAFFQPGDRVGITKHVDKIINIPSVKDHSGSASVWPS